MSPSNSFGGRPYNRQSGPSTIVRRNERIRAREVRLIGADGKQVGVITRDEALSMAREVGLDLVEVSPNAVPPVCRILDFGKYMYEQSKKTKEKHHLSRVKIIKLRARIDPHDLGTKMRRAEEFLFKGNKVKIVLQFRGREMEHPEIGMEVVVRTLTEMAHVATPDGEPKHSGRHIFASLSPLPLNKRRLKFNEKVSEEETRDDSEEGDEES